MLESAYNEKSMLGQRANKDIVRIAILLATFIVQALSCRSVCIVRCTRRKLYKIEA